MAVWKNTIAGCVVKIHDVDHDPPHCHAYVGRRDLKINLMTLEVLDPPPRTYPPDLRRGLVKAQEEMLRSWEQVTIVPRGSSPGVW